MENSEREILAAFEGSAGRLMTLADLGEPDELRGLVKRLVERGWLRAVDAPGTYVLTEDGRLQLVGPRNVTIYSRPGCHLCEEAKLQIAPVLAEFNARLTEINIDEDALLRDRYDYDVPVILIGTRKVAKHRVDLEQFRRQLRGALR